MRRELSEECQAVDEEIEIEAKKILSTEHAFLQACSICGKRAPMNDGSDEIEWTMTLTNQ